MAFISYGNGGWVRLDDPDMPGPVYLRYRSESGRPVLTEFYLDGRGQELPSGIFRELDPAGVTAWAMRGEGEWLDRSPHRLGPDLSRLASHFRTGFGSQASHWVADSMRAQILGGTVKQAPMGRETVTFEELAQPDPVNAPRDGLTDEFLRSVADNYVWAVRGRERPAKVIAAQAGASVRTVHAWIRKARDRGILAPTTRGKVG
jgi:hypothetical protein